MNEWNYQSLQLYHFEQKSFFLSGKCTNFPSICKAHVISKQILNAGCTPLIVNVVLYSEQLQEEENTENVVIS
jgi:hypothetical protein